MQGKDIEKYKPFNGFYRRTDSRLIIHRVHDATCASTGRHLNLEDGHIDHIVPRSNAELFEELFPGLDVDNIINLSWLSAPINTALKDSFPKSPMAIYYAISHNIRKLEPYLSDLLGALESSDGLLQARKPSRQQFKVSRALERLKNSGLEGALDLEHRLRIIEKLDESEKSGKTYCFFRDVRRWKFFPDFSEKEFDTLFPRGGECTRVIDGNLIDQCTDIPDEILSQSFRDNGLDRGEGILSEELHLRRHRDRLRESARSDYFALMQSQKEPEPV